MGGPHVPAVVVVPSIFLLESSPPHLHFANLGLVQNQFITYRFSRTGALPAAFRDVSETSPLGTTKDKRDRGNIRREWRHNLACGLGHLLGVQHELEAIRMRIEGERHRNLAGRRRLFVYPRVCAVYTRLALDGRRP